MERSVGYVLGHVSLLIDGLLLARRSANELITLARRNSHVQIIYTKVAGLTTWMVCYFSFFSRNADNLSHELCALRLLVELV